ncbi:hypothetical protein WL521_12810, partial [Staphylococcus epidermidis]
IAGQGQSSESGSADNQDSESLMPSEPSSASSSKQGSSSSMPSFKLKDVADISVGDERTSISKTNGKDAVNLQITKAQDANT